MLVFAFLANRIWLFELLWQRKGILEGIFETVHLLGIDFVRAHIQHTLKAKGYSALLLVVHLPAGANDSF